MKGKFLAFGVSLLAMATIGVVQLQTKALDSSRDCDQFAIIRCGTVTGDELRAEYDSDNTAGSNGSTAAQPDIKKVFSAMGISRADIQGTFKSGVVYKNGNVEVDGKVVATDARMAARGLGGTQIAGTNAQKVSVSAMGDAQTALVKVDQNGKFLFAVMKPCGNPVTATAKEAPKPQPQPQPQPQPTATCVNVDVIKQDRTKFAITANAKVTNGAKIKAYNFTITRGNAVVFNNSFPSTSESHRFVYTAQQSGDYHVKATVATTEGVKAGPACEATFTVKDVSTQSTPAVEIEKHVDTDKKYLRVNANVEFTYKIDVHNAGSVDLENVVVTDTPDRAVTLISVSPPNGQIENNTFTYTIPKLLKGETRTFVITAKVPVAQAGRIVNTACVDAPAVPGSPDMCDKAEVEVPPAPVPGKIEVCRLSDNQVVQIEESEFDENLYSKNLGDCNEETAPTELPQTGSTQTALSVIGAMSLVGASAYYVASRRHAAI